MPKRELSFSILAVAKIMEDECEPDMPFYPEDVARFIGMMFMLADDALYLEAELCKLTGKSHSLNKPKPRPELVVVAGKDHPAGGDNEH